MRPLLWVSKSHDKVADALQKQGHEISDCCRRSATACRRHKAAKAPSIETAMRNSSTSTRRRSTGREGRPVISVDTKKKELVGNYKNGGTDYRPKGDPRRVKVHDFEDKELGKVVPYGVYDVGANAGWVSVGITSRMRLSLLSPPSAAGSTRWGASATRSPRVDDHGRWRRLERNARPAVEAPLIPNRNR